MDSFWEILLWISAFIIVYTYGGYGVLLAVFLSIKRLFGRMSVVPEAIPEDEVPEVCLIIAAYNERAYVDQKVNNSLSLQYPPEKISVIWVNDGSEDGTPELVAKYPGITLLHNPKRSGKIEGMNRGVEFSKAPVLIFSDANTMLSPNSVQKVVRHFADPTVGCVAGEKRFYTESNQPVAAAGEGFYWKIESWLKRLDYRFYSTIGATGELFAIRRELFHRVEADTLLDDFMISMRATEQGFRVAYEPEAVAIEHGSSSVREELKRKVRIAAGSYQSLLRLGKLLNPFFNVRLFFQYVSHKVLRWTLAPIALPLLFLSNLVLVINDQTEALRVLYFAAFLVQVLFYGLVLFGLLTQNRPVRLRFFYAPFYFVAMNFAMYKGFFRFLKGKQSVLWEKAQRA